jgi:hypothetical protein
MAVDPEYRVMFAVDVEHSGGRGNTAQIDIREALFRILRESFTASRIEWDACHRDDLGDGMRVVVPARVPKATLLHPLIHELDVRLQSHNRRAGLSTRIRVRAALHAGDVHVIDGRMAGRALEVLARLLDADPLREALAAAPDSIPIALLISQHMYDETVRHDYPGIIPESFRKVAVNAKETTTEAWLHVSGLASPAAGPEATAVPATGSAAAGAHYEQNVKSSGSGTFNTFQGGIQHITQRGT